MISQGEYLLQVMQILLMNGMHSQLVHGVQPEQGKTLENVYPLLRPGMPIRV